MDVRKKGERITDQRMEHDKWLFIKSQLPKKTHIRFTSSSISIFFHVYTFFMHRKINRQEIID